MWKSSWESQVEGCSRQHIEENIEFQYQLGRNIRIPARKAVELEPGADKEADIDSRFKGKLEK